MRTWQKFYSEKIGKLKQAEAVYDIGGGARPKDKNEFRGYVLVDVDASYNPDLVADIQNLPFEDNSIPGIVCLSVLEHVDNPIKTAKELYRVLKPGGSALLSLPFIWPYHGNNHYPDFWRFSNDSLRILFKDFNNIEIAQCGSMFSVLVNLIPSYLVSLDHFKNIAAYLDDKFKVGRRNYPENFIFVTK